MTDINLILNDINTIFARTAKSESGNVPEKNKIKKTTIKDIKELKQLLKTDYSSAYKKYLDGKGIFRGVHYNVPEQIGKYSILKPGLKASENTQYNLYTRLFSDILPSWKDYPPRNRSFICTSSTNKALGFTSLLVTIDLWENNIYAILPKNGADIGVCPASDLWLSFPAIPKLKLKSIKFKDNLKGFQEAFMNFIRFISLIMYDLMVKDNSIPKDKIRKYSKLATIWRPLNEALEYGGSAAIVAIFNTLSNYLSKYIDDLITVIEKVDPIVKKHGFKAADRYNALLFLKELRKYNTTNILEYLDIILNAKTNGFQKVKIENYDIEAIVSPQVDENGHEVWTDSECLFVNMLFLESLK